MLFLDSSFLIGLFIKNDNYYQRAHLLRKYMDNEMIFINNIVLNEVLNSFKKNNNRPNYLGTINKITDFLFNRIKIHYLVKEDYIKSMEYFKYYNASLNFSDCTILVSMLKNNVNKIVSFDDDFDKIQGIKRIYL